MTTERQIEANRLNGAKSRGPPTAMVTRALAHWCEVAVRHGVTMYKLLGVDPHTPTRGFETIGLMSGDALQPTGGRKSSG